MLKKPITFVDFDGNTVTKDYYFNITKGELALAELESDGTWSESLEVIKNSNKGSVVIPEFKKILKWTYGERNGDEFDKSDAAWARFENTEAWSTLIMELLQVDHAAADFITAVMPEDMRGRVAEAAAVPGFRPGADTSRPTPPVAGEQPATRREAIAAEQATYGSPPIPGAPVITEPEQGIQHQSEPRPDVFGQQ